MLPTQWSFTHQEEAVHYSSYPLVKMVAKPPSFIKRKLFSLKKIIKKIKAELISSEIVQNEPQWEPQNKMRLCYYDFVWTLHSKGKAEKMVSRSCSKWRTTKQWTAMKPHK